MNSEVYDLTGRTEAQSTPAQLKLMLRNLLAERFQLKVHEETRETPYYALVAGKNSPKLDQPRPEDRSSPHPPKTNQTVHPRTLKALLVVIYLDTHILCGAY